MPRNILFIPIEENVGLSSIMLGIIYSLQEMKINYGIFKPIIEDKLIYTNSFNINQYLKNIHKKISYLHNPIHINQVKKYILSQQYIFLIAEIIEKYYFLLSYSKPEIIFIEGMRLTDIHDYSIIINNEIAKSLNADIILVSSMYDNTLNKEYLYNFNIKIQLICNNLPKKQNISIILNKLNFIPIRQNGQISLNIHDILKHQYIKTLSIKNPKNTFNSTTENYINNLSIPVLCEIPWNNNVNNINISTLAIYLDAEIIFTNININNICRVNSVYFFSYQDIFSSKYFEEEVLLIINIDTFDFQKIFDNLMKITKQKNIKCILFFGNETYKNFIHKYKVYLYNEKLCILYLQNNIFQLLLKLNNFYNNILIEDQLRIKNIQYYFSQYTYNLCRNWIKNDVLNIKRKVYNNTPSKFIYNLTNTARQTEKKIILPEGNEIRIIKAANICHEKNIASCILLGNPDEIYNIANKNNIIINKNITIIDPNHIRTKYINMLVTLRKHKGMNENLALLQLQNNTVLGTLMLYNNEAHGLVSGSINTTADTIRPALQLIKVSSKYSIISSIFFMLLSDNVVIYGDCAINTNPTVDQIAEIAIQSADSAVLFGIEPRIAMISYSTKNSGSGVDVDKIRQATLLVQKNRSDLIVDGPLQYDSAVSRDIAYIKSPNSLVAGKATICIFPDLNTGNTTYKAVQQSSKIISVGPILQGLKKPVNDLSRGSTVEDIVYVIAVTVIQSMNI